MAIGADWYLDHNLSECLFMAGFLKFAEGEFEEALKYFNGAGSLSRNISILESKDFPNALRRLRAACKQGYIIARPEEMAALRSGERVRALLGELYYVIEKLDDSIKVFQELLDDPRSTANAKAYALVGMGNVMMLRGAEGNIRGTALFERAFNEFPRSPSAAHAMLGHAYLASYAADYERNEEAFKLFKRCHDKYPNTHYGERALVQLLINEYNRGEINAARRHANAYRQRYRNNGAFNDLFVRYLNKIEEKE